jgi:Fe-S-cluster containining protein
VDDACAIYGARPLICRTQGLPLLFEAEDGEAEVDFCPLNFTAPDALADLDEEHLVPLEEINLSLVLVNQAYCREKGIEPARFGERVTMSELVLSPIEGESIE